MKAGSLPDDDAVALRECRASPSSGEVCLEVCSRYVSLCLHLFFIIVSLDMRFMFLVLGFWSLFLGTLSWSLVIRELYQRPKTKNPKPVFRHAWPSGKGT